MIFRKAGEEEIRERRRRRLRRGLFVLLCIGLFVLGFLTAGPLLSLFR